MSDNKDSFLEPPFTPGIYRHYKGNEYEALGLACHEETLEWYVMYRPLYDHAGLPDTWLRKYKLFMGSVKIDNKHIQRFTLVDKKS